MAKITGTNTYIDVEIDERMIRIYGELVFNLQKEFHTHLWENPNLNQKKSLIFHQTLES